MSDDALRHRLALAPYKAGLVLDRLYRAGLLGPESLGVILDAGDCARDDSKLLGFAIAYGELRAASIPVADTLAMAKRLGVRVNLGWSARRWKAEHDRLSRAETLKRLSEENVRYDLAPYDKFIGKRFPGYLIRTSRRLGMEGLRQRHCVASYHDRIRAGECAIAAVFIKGKRWTVELRLTGNAAHPLTVVQIKTAYNGTAGDGVREEICGLLGVSPNAPVTASSCGDRGPGDRLYMENVRRVLPVLRANNVARVVAGFDGCGDSGSISEISFEGGDFDAREITVEISAVSRSFTDGRWISERAIQAKSVYSALEEITYDFLEETGVNWYDNDGGFGDLVIDVDEGRIALDVSTRFTESETAYMAARDIESGAAVD